MISLCITTYNRYEMLMESFAQVLNDDRISEIVIVDDCSVIEYYDKIAAATVDMPKVKLFRNKKNLGMSLNKRRAIELAKEDWCILFDSDNVIGVDYLNALPEYGWLLDWRIYCPGFARPQFDYRGIGFLLNRINTVKHINTPSVEMCLNTCNFLVNRAEYLKVYEHNPEMKGTDTIWFNYLWLKAGNDMIVMSDCEYFHRVHDGSGFMADVQYNMKKAKEVKELIKQL
jgi:glycosyltransferase involved in cell wall biosynthesis